MFPNNKNDPLHKEKTLLAKLIFQLEFIQGYPKGVNRQNNALDSKLYRLKGNELFKSESHDSEIHQQILRRYSQSVALAPNKSEESALAYGNRSALQHHLKKYKDCLDDCQRAINITKSEVLKAKLTCRKLECLSALHDESFENECNIALQSLVESKMSDETKDDFTKKINDIKSSKCSASNSGENLKQNKKPQKIKNPSDFFEHQKEVQCASTSVTIAYSKRWGRHVVATQNIQPGEIIAVEKHFHKFIFPDHLYLCCNYCTKFTWSSVPCEGCIYGIYCSTKCRTAAWEEFHKFECKIFPQMWDIEGELVSFAHAMRFFLTTVHSAGGVEKLQKEFMDVVKNEDPRTKGFSDDGVFYSDRSRSILGLHDYSNEYDQEAQESHAFNATAALYYLVKDTNFFGKKLGNSLAWVVPQSKLIEFVGAIFLRLAYVPLLYCTQICAMQDDRKDDFIGVSTSPFCGLINHSCDPNVEFILTKNNETIVYARYPIKKGNQLFRTYVGDYLSKPKEVRIDGLQLHHFTCKCLACENNWASDERLPEARATMNKKFKPREIAEFDERIQSVISNFVITNLFSATSLKTMFRKYGSHQPLCKAGLLEEVLTIQKEIAAKATVRCKEYQLLDQFVRTYYLGTYGRWLDVPEIC